MCVCVCDLKQFLEIIRNKKYKCLSVIISRKNNNIIIRIIIIMDMIARSKQSKIKYIFSQ